MMGYSYEPALGLDRKIKFWDSCLISYNYLSHLSPLCVSLFSPLLGM